MNQIGTIETIYPILSGGRLKIVAQITTDSGDIQEAFLPDREVSAFLPRSILLNKTKDVPQELLKTIDPIIKRMTKGRRVRIWKYQEKQYLSFLSWRSVRFLSQ